MSSFRKESRARHVGTLHPSTHLAHSRDQAVIQGLDADAGRALPSIILFMGARRVETIKKIDDASHTDEYDYVVTTERSDAKFKAGGKGKQKNIDSAFVGKEWVKGCLISSCLLPIQSAQ